MSNAGVDQVTAEMEQSTISVMYVRYDEKLINMLHGYTGKVDTTYFRDTITPMDYGQTIEIWAGQGEESFQGYEYETDTELMGRTSNMHTYLLDSLLNASRSNIDIDVHFVPMKPNYKEIKDILELLEIAHIPNISILKFVPQGRGRINRDKLELTDEELKQFIDSLNKYKNIYSGNIRVSVPMQDEITHKCSAGLSKLDIKFDGTILPCPAFKEITTEEAKKYGIKLYTIDEIDNIILIDITRRTPLCQKVYKK